MNGNKSGSATNEPWRKPGQTSQDPDNHKPIDDAAAQEAGAKKNQWNKADPKK